MCEETQAEQGKAAGKQRQCWERTPCQPQAAHLKSIFSSVFSHWVCDHIKKGPDLNQFGLFSVNISIFRSAAGGTEIPLFLPSHQLPQDAENYKGSPRKVLPPQTNPTPALSQQPDSVTLHSLKKRKGNSAAPKGWGEDGGTRHTRSDGHTSMGGSDGETQLQTHTHTHTQKSKACGSTESLT